jgi:hypothetical protein
MNALLSLVKRIGIQTIMGAYITIESPNLLKLPEFLNYMGQRIGHIELRETTIWISNIE